MARIALCDVCGRPHLPDEGIYTVASKWDEETDELVSFRHYDCHVPASVVLAEARAKLDELTLQLDKLRAYRGHPPRRPKP